MGKVTATGRHVVGLVRAVGSAGVETEQAWVRCQRRQESVSVGECAACEHCLEVRSNRRGDPTSVICRVEVPGQRDGRSGHIELPRLCVADLMSRNVLCVRPDLSLDAVTELFVETGLKAVPVLDDAGGLLGIVTEADVVIDVHAQAGLAESLSVPPVLDVAGESLHETPPVRTVGDVMMPVALTLPETAPVTQAAALMAFEGLYHVVILSSRGQVVGILSAADILHRLARADGYVLPSPRRFGT
jgi:CBS domain-containing protein